MNSDHPRVVIIGAGFGGLWAARTLARTPAEVWLLDRNNYHTFLPLLYQIAAAEIEPEAIAYPVRSILRKMPNVHFAMADVKRIDPVNRIVESDNGRFEYDFLILATGSIVHFFGVPGAAEHTFPLKTMDQGIALRNHILSCFERAALEPEAEERQRLLTFTIVGGGPTGIEFAGALFELINKPLKKDFPTLDFREVRVLLLEARDTLLFGMPARLQKYTLKRMQQIGVEVRFQAKVERITENAVYLADGSAIPTHTVVWTAGVQGDPSVQAWGLPAVRGGRVAVQSTLQVPDHPEIYVIGDLAHLEQDGQPLPQVAPVATEQGVWAARNILQQMKGQNPLPFRYKDPGMLATIGRNAAVAYIGGRAFTGFLAWVLWLGIHLVKLIGFRNRLLVLLSWAWDYFFFERVVRLILPRQQTARDACNSTGQAADLSAQKLSSNR